MLSESIMVQDCAVCKKKCDSVEITVNAQTGNVLVVATCHGERDSHLVEREKILAKTPVILIPFAA